MERCDEQQQNIGKELHEDPGRLLKMSSIINPPLIFPSAEIKKPAEAGLCRSHFLRLV
ncbi:hypothetical protein NFX37_16850 [Serratia marcescens]|nr:hypothetical protein NFX37_16850 [Serratia marcescens]